jgi:gliding motility-associated-like protein
VAQLATAQAPVFIDPVPDDTLIDCLADTTAAPTLRAVYSNGDTVQISATSALVPPYANFICVGGDLERTWTATDPVSMETASVQQVIMVNAAADPPSINLSPTFDTVACQIATAMSGNDPLRYVNWLSGKQVEVATNAMAGCAPIVNIEHDGPASIAGYDCDELVVTFTVTDECDLQDAISFTYVTIDTLAPELLNVPDDVTISCAAEIPDPAPVVAEDCAQDLLVLFNEVSTQIVDGSCAEYNYEIQRTWTVEDSCGNSSFATQVITVRDNTAPSFETPFNVEISCFQDPEDLSLTGELTNPTDNCSPADQLEITYSDVIEPILDCSQSYRIRRTWRVTDICGNVGAGVQTIFVRDDVDPFFDVPADITVDCQDADEVFITGEPTNVTDLCDDTPTVTKTDVILEGDCPNDYTIRRTWRVEDDCGNFFEDIQIITVIDTLAPVFTTQPSNLVTTCNNEVNQQQAWANWLADLGGAEFSDNCTPGENLTVLVYESGTTNPPSFPEIVCDQGDGAIRRSAIDIIIMDECGNQTMTTITYRQEDNEEPIIYNCPPSTVIPTDPGVCEAAVVIPPVTITDRCQSALPAQETVSATQTVTSSAAPGMESSVPVDPLTFDLAFMAPLPLNAFNPVDVTIDLNNIDGEIASEHFRVFGEDDTFLGITQPTDVQCGTSTTMLSINPADFNNWVVDGVLTLRLEPNIPTNQDGRFAINAICDPAGTVTVTVLAPLRRLTPLRYEISIDGGDRILLDAGQEYPTVLDQGLHRVTYYATDCAANVDSCSYTITVEDREPPVVTCPSDVMVQLGPDSCTAVIELEPPVSVEDNCGVYVSETVQVPADTSAALLQFALDPNLNDYLAEDRTYTVTGLTASAYGSVEITLDYRGDFSGDLAYLELFDEDGVRLGQTAGGSASCTTAGQLTVSVSAEVFNGWAADGQASFTLEAPAVPVPPGVPGDGLNPCADPGPDGRDGSSYVFLSLSFERLGASFFTTGATLNNLQAFPEPAGRPTVRFNRGTTDVSYVVSDLRGNADTCTFQVVVEDNIDPVAVCQPTTVFINPSGQQTEIIDPLSVDGGSTDNCGIETYVLTPNTFDCTQVGTTEPVMLTVIDSSGNSNSCETFVSISSLGPEPTANSGVCGGDTLYLFANPPTNTPGVSYTYRWFGPNDNLISTVRDPIIPNIDEDDEGAYRVEIRGLTGCTAEGVVIVDIQELPISPTLLTNTSACLVDDLLLRSSLTPGGTSTRYQWYEGVPPSGTLLATTTQPEYVVPGPQPMGTRRFYLIVETLGCASPPSPVVDVTFEQKPTAQVQYTDTLACSGATINLAAFQAGAGIGYQWTGPNGYEANVQFPELGPLTSFSEGYYYLRTSRNGCLSEPDSILVNVKPTLGRPSIMNNGPVCTGNELILSTTTADATSYHWIGPNGQELVTDEPTLSVPNAGPAQAGDWRLFLRANGCESELSSATNVQIAPQPDASAMASPQPVCVGNDLILEGFSTVSNSSYLWTGPNDFSSNLATPLIPDVTENNAGVYRLVTTSPSGCQDTAELTVTIRPGIEITGVSVNMSECLQGGETIVLTPAAFPADTSETYLYTWSGPSSGNGATFTIPDVSPADAGNYTVIAENAEGCTSPPFTYTLDLEFAPVQPAAPATVSGESNFCVGDAFTLTTTNYTGAVTYRWRLPNGGVVLTQINQLSIPQATITDNGAYRVEVVRAGCSSVVSPPRNIQVSEIPVLAVTTNTPICADGVIQLGATDYPGAVYEWRGPNAFSSSLPNPVIPEADAALHNGTYRVFANQNGCISDTLSVEVMVLDRPVVPAIATATGSVCFGDAEAELVLALNPNSMTPGAEYQYFIDNGLTPLAPPSADTTVVLTDFSAFAGPGLYNVTVRAILNGCPSEFSAPVSVRVSDIPDNTAFAGMDTTICAGSFFLDGQAPTIGTGRWTLVGGSPAGVSIANPSLATTAVNGLTVGGGPYTFRWSLSNGACADYSTDEVVISVTAPEAADAGENILGCANETVTLGALPASQPGSTGRWTQPLAQEILGVEIIDPTDPNTVITGLQPDNLYSFNWTVTSVCGTSTDVVLVNISDPRPDAGADQIACNDDAETQLAAAAPTVGSFGEWIALDGNPTIADPSDPNTLVENLSEGENRFVWVIDGGICGDGSRDTVVVSYKIPPVAVADLVMVPFDAAQTFDPLLNDATPPNSMVNIIGSPSEGSIDRNDAGELVYTPPANFVGSATATYEIFSEGCAVSTAEITFSIGEDAECRVPNIFTPNGDNVNDAFVIPCLLNQDEYPESQVTVFNRWGDEVYRSEQPYTNDWEGTYNGEVLPTDTYFYIVDLGDGSEPLTGYVMIQR